MRVIKFRAWHRIDKEMFEVTGLEWSAASAEKLSKIMLMDGQYIHRIVWDEAVDQYEVSQFTGIKDKNGKEIYEGDFVNPSKRPYDKSKIVKANDHEVVNYDEGLLEPFYHNTGYDSETWLSDYPDFEVIGNIYENPELLK